MSTIVVEMTARELAVWRAQQRLIEQQGQMEQGYTRLGQSAGRAGGAAKQAGNAASSGWDSSKILSFAGALAGGVGISLSVVGALRSVIGWAQEAQEEVKGVAEGLQQSYTGMKQIWQVSQSAEEYQRLGAEHRLAMAREGIGRQQAMDLQFFLKSAGKEAAMPTIATSARFMDPEVAAKWFATASADINWGRQAGTPEQVLAALIAAAERSKFATGETAEWALRAAPMYAAQGVGIGEMLGIGAQLSYAAAGPEQLATYMLALQKQLSEFAEAQQLSAEERADFLGVFQQYREAGGLEPMRAEMLAELKKEGITEGDVRFQRAVTALSRGLDQVRIDVQAVSEAAKSDAAFRRVTEERPPELTLHQAREIAAIQKEIMMEPLARRQLELETAIQRMQALSVAAQRPVTIEQGWQKALEKEATFGMVEAATRNANQRFVEIAREEFPNIFREHLAGVFPSGRRETGQAFAPRMDLQDWLPKELTADQRARLDAAARAVVEQRIYEQQGVLPPGRSPHLAAAAGGDGAATPTRPMAVHVPPPDSSGLDRGGAAMERAATKLESAAERLARAAEPPLPGPDRLGPPPPQPVSGSR